MYRISHTCYLNFQNSQTHSTTVTQLYSRPINAKTTHYTISYKRASDRNRSGQYSLGKD